MMQLPIVNRSNCRDYPVKARCSPVYPPFMTFTPASPLSM
jgi:hypothetical protein